MIQRYLQYSSENVTTLGAQEAIKFQEHGKRSFLTVEDINNALRLTSEEVPPIVT